MKNKEQSSGDFCTGSQIKLNNAMLSSVLSDYSEYIFVKVIEQGANDAVMTEDKNNEVILFRN